MDDGVIRDDRKRVCPSCRMQISALATKCHFCGEEVGKPKEETRKLSVHDLGGESVQHRAPSGSVMEALESFRVEETFSAGDVPKLGGSSLDLDFGGTGGAPSAFTTAAPAAKGRASKRPASKTPMIIGIVIGIALTAGAAVLVPRMLSGLGGNEADAGLPIYINRAPQILREGGPAIKALQAAVEAIGQEDSEKNRRIAEDAVAALDGEIRALLAMAPFSTDSLSAASQLATRGADLYPGETTKLFLDEVQEDNRLYKMVLKNIDRDTKVATFIVNDPGSPEATVQEGGVLLGRFKARLVAGGSRTVTLIDTKRNNRLVVFEIGAPPRAPN